MSALRAPQENRKQHCKQRDDEHELEVVTLADHQRLLHDQPVKRANMVQLFQVITVENNTLNFVAYDVLGQERDHFTITKDFKTNKRTWLREK